MAAADDELYVQGEESNDSVDSEDEEERVPQAGKFTDHMAQLGARTHAPGAGVNEFRAVDDEIRVLAAEALLASIVVFEEFYPREDATMSIDDWVREREREARTLGRWPMAD
jgi:hypothetical protein